MSVEALIKQIEKLIGYGAYEDALALIRKYKQAIWESGDWQAYRLLLLMEGGLVGQILTE